MRDDDDNIALLPNESNVVEEGCALFDSRGFHDWRWLGWPLSNPNCEEQWCFQCGLLQVPKDGKWVDNGTKLVVAHPEDFCGKCGRPNVVWFAPSPLWNKAVRAKGECEILCPVCFVQLAEAAGIPATAWVVMPERPNDDYQDAAEELAEWIGIHPRWSRASLVHTIRDAFADVAKQRAIDAAKEIVASAVSEDSNAGAESSLQHEPDAEEAVRKIVDEWNKDNGMALLADHRDDLICRITVLLAGVSLSAIAAAKPSWSMNAEELTDSMFPNGQAQVVTKAAFLRVQKEFEASIRAAAKVDVETRHCEKCFRPLTYQSDGVPCYRCDPCEQLWPAHNIVTFSLSPVEAAKRGIVAKVSAQADLYQAQANAAGRAGDKDNEQALVARYHALAAMTAELEKE